jgi:hypothetical protein
LKKIQLVQADHDFYKIKDYIQIYKIKEYNFFYFIINFRSKIQKLGGDNPKEIFQNS